MMNNLFSMFDPSTNLFSLNWFSLMLPLMFIPKLFFYTKNRISFSLNLINKLTLKDIKINIKKIHMKIIILLITIFTMICMANMVSLMPFIFTPTSHMSTTLYLSLPLWITLTLKTMFMNTSYFMAHLVPTGTPTALVPFMVIIESISSLIRPVTLMIRLTANMIAGHVLICLLSQLLNLNPLTFLSGSMILNILLLLEMSVAMIQGYVFTILLSLYIEETR